MNLKNAVIVTFLSAVMSTSGPSLLPVSVAAAAGETQEAGQPAIAKRIGVIQAINGNSITLAPDSGPQVAVAVQPNARILRLVPGDKDLKNATPIQMQDLQVGDTIRARGRASDDAKAIAALEIIVITRSAVEAVSEQIRQDWQKRGLGGLVSAVDSATGTVTISVTGLAGKRDIAVHTSKNTVFRRYAPDSVKFDDAKASSLNEVHPGDQLRARGDRGPDGSEIAAEEIVTGSFRNVAGTVNSVDTSAGTVTVQDRLSKTTVVVRVTAESQLHKLPPEIAQRIAMRLKGAMPPGMPGAAASSSSASTPVAGNGQQSGASSGGTGAGFHNLGGGSTQGGATGGGMRPGGAADLQQMLSRMPAAALADLHKGDAVLMVTTQGTSTGGGTAITLLSGVEPILEAAPNGSQAMMLAPWSLGGAPGGDAGNQ
jgi:hypothetical protein